MKFFIVIGPKICEINPTLQKPGVRPDWFLKQESISLTWVKDSKEIFYLVYPVMFQATYCNKGTLLCVSLISCYNANIRAYNFLFDKKKKP